MKTHVTILIYFLLSTTSFVTSQISFFDGIWFHPDLKTNIRAKTYYDGIKVQGIHKRGKWVYFERCGLNSFCDRYDNLIKFRDKNKLVYYNRRSKSKFTFYPIHDKIEIRQNEERRDDNYDSYSDLENYDIKGESDTFSKDRTKNDYPAKDTQLTSFISPEGTWRVNDPNKTVFIVDTRDGIKARFSDDKSWFIFKNDPIKSGTYISEAGHRYEYIDDNNMVWIDKNGQRKYRLERIKDTLK